MIKSNIKNFYEMIISNKKFKFLFSFLMVCFLLVFSCFANTYENPNVIMGPSSSVGNAIKFDEENFALESFAEIMTDEDLSAALYYISEYRKGEKSVESALTNIISKYNQTFAQLIVNYMLRDNHVRLLSTYFIDHTNNTANYIYIKGLTPVENDDIRKNGNELWNKILKTLPEDYYNNINCLYLEMNKPDEDTVTICELDDIGSKWAMYVDIRLLSNDSKDEFFEQMIYNTTYYYLFRTDQIAFDNIKKGNYSYGKHYYKDSSYIDIFYKKYWKGRRKEINLGQIDLYPNDFINNKASRTVYNDMAISYYNYVKFGPIADISKIIAEKINFFDKYDLFRSLSLFFRIKYSEY